MMKKMGLMVVILAALVASADEREYLWPKDKMPHRQEKQHAALTTDPNPGTEPYIEWFDLPATAKKTDLCLILISGGGYGCQCDVALIDMWRKRFGELGVQCVNLVHRTPRPLGLPFYQSAWEDGQRAVRLVRSEAKQRGFNPEKIGTISMSAGSHLSTLLATSSQTPAYEPIDEIDKVPAHLNWALTHAIAYALTDGLGTENTTGGNGDDVKLDAIFKFDAKTCPMCMTHGARDVYSPIASTKVYRKLREMNIPAEVHLYADRPHGANGLEWQVAFLHQLGFFGELKAEEGLEGRYAKDGEFSFKGRENLWPEGKMPNAQAEQGEPYIEWFVPKRVLTKAIQIIYSGGAYDWNNPDSFEVAPMRRYLNAKGMTVVTMRYRTPRPKGLPKHLTAWQDLQRAVRMVKSEAPARGLDPERVGIMGSSAGGHLTMMGVTTSMTNAYAAIDEIDQLSPKVKWGIAVYPAYLLTDGLDGENVRWGNDDDCVLGPDFAFDENSCPVFFIHGDADGYSAMGSVKAWEKLRRMGIQCDCHTLATRKHCFQAAAAPDTGSYNWMDPIWEFLTNKHFNSYRP